jgi:hypothetical protein
LIDAYGFQFPHDYPLQDVTTEIDEIGEGSFAEESGKRITENWLQYYPIVKEKYERRIQRFLQIMRDTKPVIAMCRYSTNEVMVLQRFLSQYYNKTNIIFINSSTEPFCNEFIRNCYTEVHGKWNDKIIWKKEIDHVIDNQIFLQK